jgi:hypothetical protein
MVFILRLISSYLGVTYLRAPIPGAKGNLPVNVRTSQSKADSITPPGILQTQTVDQTGLIYTSRKNQVSCSCWGSPKSRSRLQFRVDMEVMPPDKKVVEHKCPGREAPHQSRIAAV